MQRWKTQRELHEALLANDSRAFAYLYPLLHARVARLVLDRGGTDDDVRSLLQESIVAFLYNLRYKKYVWRDDAELTTYILGITKNLLRQQQRDRNRFVADHTEEHDPTDQTEEEELFFEAQRETVEHCLSEMDEPCRQTIELYYWQNQSMAEIAQLRGWANEVVARKAKFRCLEKLRQKVFQRLNPTTWP